MPENVFVIPEDRMEDPREQEDWFARLPDEAKDELRDRWRMEEGKAPVQAQRRMTTLNRYVLEGLILFGTMELLFGTTLSCLLAAVVGGIAGYVAGRIRSGSMRQGIVFAVAYMPLLLVVPRPNLFGLLLVASAGSLLGSMHNIQRFDGSET